MDIEPNQDWTIDLFRPDDADGVASLFLKVYGEAYPIKTFIDPDKLREENAAGRTISSVAKTGKGEIIGHNAIFRSAPSPVIFEAGAGVVDRAYRGGQGIFTQLNLHGVSMAKAFGVSAIFGEPVCNHPFAQQMGRRINTISRALEIDLLPAEAYVKEKSSSGRVAALFNFATVISRPHRVFLPDLYVEALKFCYEELDDERQFDLADQAIPAEASTCINNQFFDFAKVARLSVWEAGSDFGRRLADQEAASVQQGAVVIQLWLKMTCPWLGEVVSLANRMGYFFGGVLLRWFDDDGLLLQKVVHKPNFEGIVLHYDRGKTIYDLVRADWLRVKDLLAGQ